MNAHKITYCDQRRHIGMERQTELFLNLGGQLRRNKELAARNTHREYLLRGLVKCTGCGRRMTGYSHARYSYYRCPVQAQKKYSTASKCVTPSVRADRLEPAVWEAVTELLKNPERLREEILQRRGKDSPPRTLIEEQLVLRRKRFSEIPAEQDSQLSLSQKSGTGDGMLLGVPLGRQQLRSREDAASRYGPRADVDVGADA